MIYAYLCAIIHHKDVFLEGCHYLTEEATRAMAGNHSYFSAAILARFGITDPIARETVLENGHINGTYRIELLGQNGLYSVILQSVNTYVFSDPIAIMRNIDLVTSHIRSKLVTTGKDPERRVMHWYKTAGGKNYYIDENGSFWRSYTFIENAHTIDWADNPDLLYKIGCAFGGFQKHLSDFPMHKLTETIPDFHNTPLRLAKLEEAIALDPRGRVKELAEEIRFFRDRAETVEKLISMQKEGILPLRVTHNDTKCNNVLIDTETGEGVCVIDLDTVMPGLAAYDFGDAIRFAANTASEDETDLSKVSLSMEYFDAFTRGFIGESASFFTPAEISSMAWGALIITIELASRFLADHILGDLYFRIHRSGHNLDRARNQIKLAESMEAQFDKMCACVGKYAKKTIG